MAKDYVTLDDKGLLAKIDKLTPEIKETLLDETKIQSDLLTNYIIENHVTGGTSATRLKVRSGNFRSLVLPILPKTYSKTMKGGTNFGAKSAGVHVGEKGYFAQAYGNKSISIKNNSNHFKNRLI